MNDQQESEDEYEKYFPRRWLQRWLVHLRELRGSLTFLHTDGGLVLAILMLNLDRTLTNTAIKSSFVSWTVCAPSRMKKSSSLLGQSVFASFTGSMLNTEKHSGSNTNARNNPIYSQFKIFNNYVNDKIYGQCISDLNEMFN